MDASPFVLFGEDVSHFHISVDDCTGVNLEAYLDHQEALKGYYEVDKNNILNPCLLHFLLRDLFVNLFQRVFDRYTC